MKRLVPAHVPPAKLEFDPITSFPDDVAKLVAVAKAAGYLVSPADAAEIWQRASDSVCASWLSVMSWRETDILKELTQYGVSVEASENWPEPPHGCVSWLDYAVDTMDVRSAELERLFEAKPGEKPPNREEMRQAVRAELAELRQKAGRHGQYRLSDLMAQMPEGLPRAEGWDEQGASGKAEGTVLIQGRTNRSQGLCPVCGNSYSATNRFAVFSAVALRRTGPESAVMDEHLTGFMDLFWHDHEGGSAGITLAEDAPAGQTEIYVCSTTCMRRLFNGWVDALETAIDARQSKARSATEDTLTPPPSVE